LSEERKCCDFEFLGHKDRGFPTHCANSIGLTRSPAFAKVHADKHGGGYRGQAREPETVNQGVGENSRGMANTRGISNFRSFFGMTLQEIGPKHLDRNVSESAGRQDGSHSGDKA